MQQRQNVSVTVILEASVVVCGNRRKSLYLVSEICFYCRVCGLSAPALFIFLQKPLFQNQAQATLVVLASRGRSRSSTSPQRKEARSDVIPVLVYLYPQLEVRIYIFSLFFLWAAVGRPLLWTLQQ